ncbi:MAG: CARDB domain-containing protein, partial [Candidatus Thermoplasmatota archaeon]|nr:CARDB domain-containing protein [Candidatus Thermoplasmatota archaeon]
TAQCYFVKSSNGDNSTSFSISVYSDNYPVPLRIEAYDGNRELVGVLRLKSAQAGDGTFFGIDNVEWPSGKPPANEEISISVTIRNEGTSPGATWVALLVDGSLVSNVTSGSINSGETAVVVLKWTPAEGEGYELAVMTSDILLQNPNLLSIGPAVSSPAEDFMLYGLIAILVLVAVVVLFLAKKRGENKLLKEHDKKQGKTKNTEKESGRAKPEAGEISIEVDDESIEVTSKKETISGTGSAVVQPANAKEETGGEKTPVKCSKCGSSTKVFIDQKPYKFKCPDCGAKLMIK